MLEQTLTNLIQEIDKYLTSNKNTKINLNQNLLSQKLEIDLHFLVDESTKIQLEPVFDSLVNYKPNKLNISENLNLAVVQKCLFFLQA